MSEGIDWNGYAQRKAQEKAAVSRAQGDAVSPQAAVDALRVQAPTNVPAEVGMHDPEPLVAQAREQENTTHLESTPGLTNFVASSPVKAAAVKDDYGPLAKIAGKVNEWNRVATEDFFAPGKASGRALLRDASDWFTMAQDGNTPLDLLPGFSAKDQKLGHVLADLFGVAVSPITGGLNMAARPFSYIPSNKVVDGKLVPRTQEENQSNVASMLGTALSGLGAGGLFRAPTRPGPVNEGLVGARPRLTGPKEQVPDAVFEDFKPPGVEPSHTPVYGAVAELDAAHVGRMQEAVAESATHTRSPALMEDYLANHTEAGTSLVTIPPDTIAKLWAEGHNVFAEHLPAIQDALVSGGEVSVPLSTYLTETAGKPFAEELNNATKFRETGVSVDEAKELPKSAEGGEAPSPSPRGFEVPEDIGPEHAEPVREVAARADSVVDQVFKEAALDKLFVNAKAAGMTEGQLARYSARVEEAQAALHDKLLQRTYTQIRRERTPEFKAARDLHLEEATNAIKAQPNVVAFQALREPLFKLDTELLAEAYPDLPLSKVLHKRGGLAPDDAAELAGYPNGAALVSDLHHLSVAIEAGGGSLGEYVKARAGVYADEQARGMVGYGVEPDDLLAAAREMVAAPQIEDVLTDALRDFAKERSLPFDKDAVRELAKSQFDKLPVKEAVKTRQFVENMRKLGNRAEVALMDEKDLKAFQLKQQQLLQYHQVVMSQFLAKKVGVAERKFARLARRKTIDGLAQSYLDQLHSYLPRVGFESRRNPLELGEALGGVTVEQFVAGVTSVNPVFPAVPVYTGPLESALVDQFWTVREFVYAMDKFGREVQTLKTAEGKVDFEASVQRFVANAPPAGKRRPPRMGGRKDFFERQVAKFRGYDASHRKIADIGEFFDRGKPDGVMAQVLEYPIEAASDKDGKLRRETYKPVNDAFYSIPDAVRSTYNGVISSTDHPFSAPDGTPMEVRRGDVPAIALYVGQESALVKLAEGYSTTPMDVLQFLDEHLTAPEVQFVQKVWDMFEDLSVEVSEQLRAMTGTGLQKEPNRQWITPHGTMKGGYWPIRYDKELDRSALDREAARAVNVGLDPVNQFFAQVAPDRGFANLRTGYKGPVLIRLSEVAGAFDAHIKYASYAQTIASIRRFINDKRVAATISSRMGPEYYAQFNPWLDAVVLDYTISDKGATALQALAHQARINTTMSVLGFSYTTGISQVAGLSGSIGVLGDNLVDGTLRMAHGLAKFGRIMASGRMKSEIFDQSEFMAQRFGEVEPNMVEAINATQGLSLTGGRASQAYKAVQNAGLAYIGWAEFLTVSGPTWIAAREKALGQFGMSAGDAIRYADRIVRKSQGSGRRVDLAAVQRGDAFQRWFYMFNTFFNAQYQRMIETGREVKGGNYGKAFALFAGLFIISPLLANLLTNHGPKDGKAGTIARWAAQSVFFNLFRPMFLLGNMTSTIDRNLTAQNGKWTLRPARDLDFSADPSTRMIQALAKGAETASKLAAGKKAGRPVQSLASAVGIPFGIPGSIQAGRTGEYLYELTSGQQKPKDALDVAKGLLVGPQASQTSSSTSTGGSHK